MGRTSSEDQPRVVSPTPRARDPLVFAVSSDANFLATVLAECSGVPELRGSFRGIDGLIDALSRAGRLDLAVALVVEKAGRDIDPALLRRCKLEFPQLTYILLLESCEQTSFLRFQSIGVQNIIVPPFTGVNLSVEIATALPNVSQFKRHNGLMRRGSVRLDFLIPSDLSYILGVNYMVSLLLKEFAFPQADSRINVPLACDEALTNAIVHGNGGDREKTVAVQIHVSSSRVKIRIEDRGRGFDHKGLEDPTEAGNVMRSSGRGVYLMSTMMDSVIYKKRGRVVELEKANANQDAAPAGR